MATRIIPHSKTVRRVHSDHRIRGRLLISCMLGDLIIHLVKIFNDGTEAAYSSTVVDRSIYSQTLRDLRANLSKQQVLDSQA